MKDLPPLLALSRWTALWKTLGGLGDPLPWHARLVTAYRTPDRHYHDTRHIAECLTELDAARPLAAFPPEVEAALWFHDAVYDARSATNERDSAKLAAECLGAAQAPSIIIEQVCQLVLCTKTHEPGSLRDGALLIDIDLAILGQPPARFWEYEHAIREEYHWVPEATYREKRAEVLARFLARSALYTTEHFREKYEASARHNLSASLEKLRAPSV